MMKGRKITLVNKEDGGPVFLKVAKVGRKYIYGAVIWDDDGTLKPAVYETRWDMSKYAILDGLQLELKKQYLLFQKAVNERHDARTKARRELEWKARDWVWAELEKWDEAHPKPEPPKPETRGLLMPFLKG